MHVELKRKQNGETINTFVLYNNIHIQSGLRERGTYVCIKVINRKYIMAVTEARINRKLFTGRSTAKVCRTIVSDRTDRLSFHQRL